MPVYSENTAASVSAPAAAQTRPPASKPGQAGGILDKDAFLSLLITQLKYQDPMNPMEDTQFVAQMAQFASLEQMQNMNKSMSLSQGFALIGRHVSGSFKDGAGPASEVSGVAQGVSVKNGEVYVNVNGSEVPIGSITDVSDVSEVSGRQ
ncbi:MAG: flagellar hook capping protein [Firmicutes bacterium]|nr:flagellar hook capping protein [Bacillota bacterium]